MCRTREHTGTILSYRSQPISPRSSDYRVSNLGLAVAGEQQRGAHPCQSVQPTKRKTVRKEEAKAAANIRGVGTRHGEIEEKRGELGRGKRGKEETRNGCGW